MIEILNDQRRRPIDEKKFEGLLRKLIDHYKLEEPEVTLAFVNNRAIQDLNLKFLHKDKPTDVLSFPLGEKGADGKFYLGDIMISVPYAARQARELKRTPEREMEYLTLHGFLHLMGYEHFKGLEEEEEKMRQTLFPEDYER